MGSGASKNRTESPPTKQPPTTRIETPVTSLGSSAPTTPGGAASPSDERDSSSFKETRTDDQYVIQFQPEEVTHDDINSSPSGSFPKKAAGEEGGSSVKGESFARRRGGRRLPRRHHGDRRFHVSVAAPGGVSRGSFSRPSRLL